MYVDLLTRALGNDETEARSADLLLADVVSSRARLRAAKGDPATSAAESLARELAYDGALIRLCGAMAVAAIPAWYLNPGSERARLERELVDRGVALAGVGAGARTRTRAGARAGAGAGAGQAVSVSGGRA
jgi:hypothetical protein